MIPKVLLPPKEHLSALKALDLKGGLGHSQNIVKDFLISQETNWAHAWQRPK